MKALAITAAAIAGILVAAMGWLVVRSDPLGGEPVAVFALDPAMRPDPKKKTSKPDPQNTAPPVQSERAATPKQPADASTVTMVANQGPITLPDVPEQTLIENSRYGPLPKIAVDGRRPSEIYARPSSVAAVPRQGEPARIAILINGLGLSEQITTDAISKLPKEVSLAFSPYGRNLQGWVRQARGAGHEIMLQIPLEPFDYPDNDPGPQTLLTSLSPEDNRNRLLWLLARFTGYTGVTNHMGAKFASAQDAFLPVLEELRSRGLIYVDDGTSARSTAGQIARDLGLGFSVAQVLIDADGTPDAIDQSLTKLEEIAKEDGFAVGIGGSLPATISRIAEWAQALKRKGIVLIPVSAAVHASQAS